MLVGAHLPAPLFSSTFSAFLLSISASQHLSISASQHLSISASQHLSILASQHLQTVTSPIRNLPQTYICYLLLLFGIFAYLTLNYLQIHLVMSPQQSENRKCIAMPLTTNPPKKSRPISAQAVCLSTPDSC